MQKIIKTLSIEILLEFVWFSSASIFVSLRRSLLTFNGLNCSVVTTVKLSLYMQKIEVRKYFI